MDREHIEALAPDAASVTAAKKLENPDKWPRLNFNERAIWGECLGSGSTPYAIRIDRAGNAFKCSCPSRKFPCKHGLALYFLFVDKPQTFSQSTPPDWVSEWLEGRDTRSAAALQKAEEKVKNVDPEARKKRLQKREEKILAGIDELSRWLEDVIRVGIAELPNQPYSYWDDLAARMVDAQAPGLAAWIRRLGGMVAAVRDAMPTIASELGKLHLFVEAYKKMDKMPELAEDLRSIVGVNKTEAEVRLQPGVQDNWLVVAKRQSIDGSLIMQTTWLYGIEGERFAKVIQYAHESQRAQLVNDWIEGKVLQGSVHYYPSLAPLRCIVGDYSICEPPDYRIKPGREMAETAMQKYRDRLCQQPWLDIYPLRLDTCIPVLHGKQLYLEVPAQSNNFITVNTHKLDIWKLLAVSGGEPITVFGEWNGEAFQALSALQAHKLTNVQTGSLL